MESNIYNKLMTIRHEIEKADLKKSGYNTFSKYSYYELKDFMPTANKLMREKNVFAQIVFDKEIATLKFINLDNLEDVIVFTSPMGSAELKACHDIQNLGAVHTYLRRYLYINAFDIIENCKLDLTTGESAPPKVNKANPSPKTSNAKCPHCTGYLAKSKTQDQRGNDYLYCSEYRAGCKYTQSMDGKPRTDNVTGKFIKTAAPEPRYADEEPPFFHDE